MSDPFLGEIQIYGFNFAPYGWAMCQGQQMPVQQNTALFSLLGTLFGGNGTTNFQLPNYAGAIACGQGDGAGLTPRAMGDTFGTETVTLTSSQMPLHTHGARIYNQPDKAHRKGIPASGNALITPESNPILAVTPTANTTFPPATVGIAGSNSPHENRQPYLAVNFCIALSGAYPQRP